ncbi:hypothetical protein GHT06_021376 [Daphnia sinensis]|uniref:Uncharacterized protein n=1 Tax=Daphnia sinensis TaxID=1820382 RepID=A0AAD5L075_9CRUS|nr:hypothetical protein GHT06_021376 [Daphnia sinensis]
MGGKFMRQRLITFIHAQCREPPPSFVSGQQLTMRFLSPQRRDCVTRSSCARPIDVANDINSVADDPSGHPDGSPQQHITRAMQTRGILRMYYWTNKDKTTREVYKLQIVP